MRKNMKIAAFCFCILFLPVITYAQQGGSQLRDSGEGLPVFQTALPTNEIMTRDLFNFISGLLHSGKMAPDLRCSFKVREIKETRKFSSGSKYIEALSIEFSTDHFGPRTVDAVFTVGTPLGRRQLVNDSYGPVEEIKIVNPDPDRTWLQFQHDGKRIVWAAMGSVYTQAPCLLSPKW